MTRGPHHRRRFGRPNGRIWIAAFVCAMAALTTPRARAEHVSNEVAGEVGAELSGAELSGAELSGAAVSQALREGAPGKALVVAEALADRGYASPELAYHRGLAYAMRVGTSDEIPGDGGQAIAAFRECEALGGRGEVLARSELGLRPVRSHLARKRQAAGLPPALEPSQGLLRALLASLGTRAWLSVAAILGLLSALAAALAWRAAAASRGVHPGRTRPGAELGAFSDGERRDGTGGSAGDLQHVSARLATAAILGALSLAVCGAAWAAEAMRFGEVTVVVVAAQAPLVDGESGVLVDDEPLAEGLALRVFYSDGATLALADRPGRGVLRSHVRVLHSQR